MTNKREEYPESSLTHGRHFSFWEPFNRYLRKIAAKDGADQTEYDAMMQEKRIRDLERKAKALDDARRRYGQ